MKLEKENQTKVPIDWGKVFQIIGIGAIVIGAICFVWFGEIVPNDISAKVIAQALITTLILMSTFAVIWLVRRGWV